MHLGLWFERFFDAYKPDFSEVDIEQRKNWLKALAQPRAGSKARLSQYARHLRQLASARQGQTRIYHCTGNFVTGLGNAHPLENGFLWHPTLGTPYLPGSAVKGLVRAVIETAYEGEDKGELLKRWFGTAQKGDVPEHSGQFIFLDALPIEPCPLHVEVMTPHMGKWYEQGGKKPLTADVQPGDWHAPVPVSYLTARDLKLQFIVLPRAGTGDLAALVKELGDLWQALDYGLQYLDAGAKTAIGFGCMKSEEQLQFEAETARKREQQRRDEEKAREAQQLEATADTWEGARLKFNAKNGSLSAEKNGQTAIATAADSPKGTELFASLPSSIQQKIKSGQFVKVTARVAKDRLLGVTT